MHLDEPWQRNQPKWNGSRKSANNFKITLRNGSNNDENDCKTRI